MSPASPPANKEYFYEAFADEFDSRMNMYDTRRRVELIFGDLLPEDLTGKRLLDAGCGTGWFSQAAGKRNAEVTAMDLGERLLSKVKEKCQAQTVVGSVLEIPFPDDYFDVVVSSEVIEHTTAPTRALFEFARVLKPGGVLIVTTPNRLWYFSVALANALKLRPYQGLENWISWRTFLRTHREAGLTVETKAGVHLFPFVFSFLHPLLSFFDRFNRNLYPVMINMAVRSTKRKPAT
jgi:2-polyprenyl-3-methyl-5-hydroxy-6-metoxy-1,4-benzoquinol methylase